MIYNDGIKKGLENRIHKFAIARKIYLSFPTFAFDGDKEREFQLIDAIRDKFNIPFTSVQVVGSSKTGYSYFRNRKYVKGESDLDIAIIDSLLFNIYAETVFLITNGFNNTSGFGRNEDGISNFEFYSQQLTKGIFRPDLIPACDIKRDWFNFFNKLSQNYLDLFSDINAGIYQSEVYFEIKQSQNVDWFKNSNL